MTISPTEKGSFLFNKMAMISAPSSEPPKRITIPTPAPNTIPPKTVAKRRSSVKTGTLCKREVVIDRTVMPKTNKEKVNVKNKDKYS